MKIISRVLLILILCIQVNCTTDDNGSTDPINDVTNGAVIQRVATASNILFSENLDGSLDTLLEYRDAEEGTLLDELQIFVLFMDNSEGEGNSTDAIVDSEVLVRTVNASEFETGELGFPRYNLVINSEDFLTATNNTVEGIATNDIFFTRLALFLTDGRVFSSSNISNNGNLNTDFIILTEVE